MNFNSSGKCEPLNTEELVYHSSEQYLILCLNICRLIIKNHCSLRSLVDLDRFTSDLRLLNGSESSRNRSRAAFGLRSNEQLSFLFDLEPAEAAAAVASSSAPQLGQIDLIRASYTPLLLSNLNETECGKYGHRESYKLSLFVFGVLLCFFILLLNSLTLTTIIRSRRLHSISNILIANLSVSDFLLGVAFLYPCILNLLTINALETYNSSLYKVACNIRQNYYVCLVGYSPMITSMLSSMFTLTLLALEKYMAIMQPYIYERLIEDRKYLCYLILALTWTASVLVSLLPIMGWNEHNSAYRGFNCTHAQSLPCMFERIFTLNYILLFTGICGLCAVAMLAIYVRIYLTARKHSKQIAQIQQHVVVASRSQLNESEHHEPGTTVSSAEKGEFEMTPVGQPPEPAEEIDLNVQTITSTHSSNLSSRLASAAALVASRTMTTTRMSMKAMKTLLILLLGFYLCWLPLIVYFLTFASQKYNNMTIYILMFVACCNAVIDPLVYAFRNRDFCNELLLNFHRRR